MEQRKETKTGEEREKDSRKKRQEKELEDKEKNRKRRNENRQEEEANGRGRKQDYALNKWRMDGWQDGQIHKRILESFFESLFFGKEHSPFLKEEVYPYSPLFLFFVFFLSTILFHPSR